MANKKELLSKNRMKTLENAIFSALDLAVIENKNDDNGDFTVNEVVATLLKAAHHYTTVALNQQNIEPPQTAVKKIGKA